MRVLNHHGKIAEKVIGTVTLQYCCLQCLDGDPPYPCAAKQKIGSSSFYLRYWLGGQRGS